MTENHLHIIAFDVPYPANYGGVIDVFYRVKALIEAGVKVHLHCFEYGRGEQEVLKRCHEVKYYKRDTSFAKQLSLIPFIVNSRRSEELVKDLLKDDYPILCEGLHTTYALNDNRLKNRKIYVRAHNVEHDYYKGLGDAEKFGWKRLFYYAETWKLTGGAEGEAEDIRASDFTGFAADMGTGADFPATVSVNLCRVGLSFVQEGQVY